MTRIDFQRHVLDPDVSKKIFLSRIVPRELLGPSAVSEPRAIFVAGQPGAGKTRSTESVVDYLVDKGESVVVNTDFYKPYHPMYRRLLQQDDHTAAAYVSVDGRRWMAMAMEWLIAHRQNVIIETTMRDPGVFTEPAATFRQAGYRTEAIILVVPEAQSRLGILSRYQDQVIGFGHGRLTDTPNHDASYQGVLAAAVDIDTHGLVDGVVLHRRGNVVLYENSLDEKGFWRRPPEAADVIVQERSRTWTPSEANDFLREVRRLHSAVQPELLPMLDQINSLAAPYLPAVAVPYER